MKRRILTTLIVLLSIACGELRRTDNTADTGNTADSGNSGDTGDAAQCVENEVRNCVDFDSFERCVAGTWETISLTHEGREWSCISPDYMTHFKAPAYCEDNGWHLPTISELRTLIRNCPDTENDSTCGVTDSCLSHADCWNDTCFGCSEDDSGKYSVFGDTSSFWSSSVLSDNTDGAWGVTFRHGSVDGSYRNYDGYVRCVR